MAYRKWVIGGITPTWVEPDFEHNRQNKTLTLKCAAIYDEIGADPVTEIDQFQALASESIHNDGLLNGGTKLQANQIIEVTASNEAETETITWDRCALQEINVALDSYYDEDVEGSVIEYELLITYQTIGTAGVISYSHSYDEKSNIEYYMWTDKTNTGAAPDILGSEVGWMQITETEDIRKVEVYGSACCSPSGAPAWIEVNGVRQYWHYTHDMMATGDSLPSGFEKLTWELSTVAKVITIETSQHIMPSDTCAINTGCWLQWVKLTLA